MFRLPRECVPRALCWPDPPRGVRRCPGHPPPSRPHRPRARSARCVVGRAHPASLRLTRRRAASTRYRTGSARASATGQPSARGCPERSASMRSRTWRARRGSLTTGVPISARSAATSCIAWRATSRLRPPRWWRSERGGFEPTTSCQFSCALPTEPPARVARMRRLARNPLISLATAVTAGRCASLFPGIAWDRNCAARNTHYSGQETSPSPRRVRPSRRRAEICT